MKKALIVVDYQNDFVVGSLGFEKAKSLENVISAKIESYKYNELDVIYTFDTHFENYLNTSEGKSLPVKHCILGTEGHKLYGNIATYFSNESISFKKSTFGSLDLANFLKENNYDSIELVGLVSNMCVLSNAIMIKAAIPEARIVVDASATASFDESLNEKALDILEALYITVINREIEG